MVKLDKLNLGLPYMIEAISCHFWESTDKMRNYIIDMYGG